jgi:hypothetical protein
MYSEADKKRLTVEQKDKLIELLWLHCEELEDELDQIDAIIANHEPTDVPEGSIDVVTGQRE